MRIKKPARKQTFTVTCTEEEKREIFQKAQESGRTVSGYIRWMLANYQESEKKRRKAKEAGKNDRD